MITYKVTNITNGMWYVGSTNDFERRKQEHLRQNYTDHFHRSLQKNSNNFIWEIVRIDDLKTRDYEQKILDEHYGKPYCYNVNSNACGFNTDQAKFAGSKGGKIGGKIAGNKRVNQIGSSGMKELSLLAHQEKNENGKSINAVKAGDIAAHKSSKPIRLICKITDQIFEYRSINEASKEKNINRSSIWYVLTGKRKSVGGFYVEYVKTTVKETATV
jgi:group I intron endonuclease